MEKLIKEHCPRIFFTNTALHNPTGVSINQSVAYRMLQLAEKYDIILVEDDIYGDFHPSKITRLATLDQLDRVICVSSISKTLFASLRVVYFACKKELAENLCEMKPLTGLTTSEVSECIIYQLLSGGHFRKHLEPEGGMFILVKLNDEINMTTLAAQAAKEGVMLAPGNIFRPYQEPSPWLRFNVAHCENGATFEILSKIVKNTSK